MAKLTINDGNLLSKIEPEIYGTFPSTWEDVSMKVYM